MGKVRGFSDVVDEGAGWRGEMRVKGNSVGRIEGCYG